MTGCSRNSGGVRGTNDWCPESRRSEDGRAKPKTQVSWHLSSPLLPPNLFGWMSQNLGLGRKVRGEEVQSTLVLN